MVSKSRRSCQSKRLTDLEYARNMATTTQLSNQDEDGTTKKWAIQMVAGRHRNFCLLCENGKTSFTFAVRRLNAPLAPPANPPCSKAKGKTRAINGENRASRNSRWHYDKPDSPSTLFRPPLSASICLRPSVSIATNYSCFVSTIMCFYQHFFLMYP